jgi:hypothetical protein
MITFSIFSLPHFFWSDRFDFSGVVQQQERALNGALHIEHSLITTGRPITLHSDLEDADLFMQLQAHAAANQEPFTLSINGIDYNVAWLHKPIAVKGMPYPDYSDADPAYFENITLQLHTV